MTPTKSRFPHLLEILPEAGDVTIATLELLWRAAPEQVAELDQLFAAGVQARLSKGLSPTLGVIFNVLQIPEIVLQQLWLLSHAAWHDLLEFDKLRNNKNAKIERSLVLHVVEVARSLSKGGAPQWPREIPKFNEVKEGVQAKAVRELYAMATAWAIAHEMRHAKFHETSDRPHDPITEEYECDVYAADFLFEKIEEYSKLTNESVERVRGKRAMGALVGLYYVAKLSHESSTSETHPPIHTRIKLLFEKVGSNSAQYFWGFAIALLWGLKPEIASIPVTVTNPSDCDLAHLALSEFH